MVRLDYECPSGHQFQRMDKKAIDNPKCPECGSRSEILWIGSRSPHQQFSKPVTFWRYADGRLGVAASADSRTPPGADRVECHSRAHYNQVIKEMNGQLRSKERRKQEAFEEGWERQAKARRDGLITRLAQETDPAAREIYRHAIENQPRSDVRADLREWFSEVME